MMKIDRNRKSKIIREITTDHDFFEILEEAISRDSVDE
jgi:hypothetical protein